METVEKTEGQVVEEASVAEVAKEPKAPAVVDSIVPGTAPPTGMRVVDVNVPVKINLQARVLIDADAPDSPVVHQVSQLTCTDNLRSMHGALTATVEEGMDGFLTLSKSAGEGGGGVETSGPDS